jgi:ABC-type multidrug transport system fused ATPase/permease subunit
MKQKIFWRIALACFLASFISAMMLQRIGLRYFFQLIPQSVITIITLVYFIAMLFYIVIGINAKVHKEGDTTSLLAFWQDAIRYFIALDMFVFGLCKFFHIQFNTPMALLDNPFNTIANDDLMWAFYGRSYAFTLLIGTMEMVGALLLLFKRTWLVAIFFLLPICLNIFCLDIFYNGIGTAVYIAIEIMGLIYLLFIEYDRLIQFFFVDKSNAAEFNFKKSGLKNMIKLSVVIIPAILMILVKKRQYYPELTANTW